MLFRNKKTAEEKLAAAVPIPANAPDKRYSALYSMENQPGKPTRELMTLGLECIQLAMDIDLTDISARIKSNGPDYMSIYPGEHYKLLAAVIKKCQPRKVVELGTHLGYSALCMKKFLPAGSTIHTFDVIPWNGFSDTILTEKDFDAQLVQHTDDLTQAENVQKHLSLLQDADIIFMDALKDGKQEYLFLKHFSGIRFNKKCLMIFDDIRLWNMLDIWYNLDKPKLDLTSFGHWSGTGFVQWS
jgi:predicted O-methyltransferase YrrM